VAFCYFPQPMNVFSDGCKDDTEGFEAFFGFLNIRAEELFLKIYAKKTVSLLIKKRVCGVYIKGMFLI
jgi:hypothetical protein